MRTLLLGGCAVLLVSGLLVAGVVARLGDWLARDQPSDDE